MLENTERNSRDFSVYDKMATDDLKLLLLADIDSDDQVMDMEVLCYVTELITKRENESGIPRKTTQDAYAEFREKYMYSDDLADAEDIDNPSESVEVSSPKEPSRVIPFIKRLPRVAVIAITVLVLSATLVMSVDAFRTPIINYFNTVFSDHSQMSFAQDPSRYYPHNDIIGAIQDAPIPDSYKLDSQIIDGELIMLSYCGVESSYIALSIAPMQSSMNYDTEGLVATEMTIEGHDAIFYEKDNLMQIVWLNEECKAVYLLTTHCLSENRFWELARYWAIQNIELSGG